MEEGSVPPSEPERKRPGPKRQKISGMRLENKRRADRESQRAGRERTRNHIMHLERLVESLKKGDHLGTLVQQCEELREQNERLTAIITNISRLANSADLLDPKRNNRSNSMVSSAATSSAAATESIEKKPFVTTAGVVEKVTPIMHDNPTTGQQPPWSWEEEQSLFEALNPVTTGTVLPPPGWQIGAVPNATLSSSTVTQTQNTEKPCSDDKLEIAQVCKGADGSLCDSVNHVITSAESFSAITTELRDDIDIAIRAVLDGWHLVTEMYALDYGWRALRYIDEHIFASCGPVERLAVLRIMRLKLRHAAQPSPEHLQLLPAFMHFRPLQQLVEHFSLFDYFVWPDLRDVMILSCSNEKGKNVNQLATSFTANLRFRWPYKLSTAWSANSHTGLYSFSSLFSERFADLQCWTLASDFFNYRPDLIGYVPMYNPSPSIALGGSIPQGDGQRTSAERVRKVQNEILPTTWWGMEEFVNPII